ncbi:MAG: [citrate (pro-3S)-lyase] ligase [Oscillospiraceae bacterium]
MAYAISVIEKNDLYSNRCMDKLLEAEGIRRDRNLDYSCGIFDDGELIATGSCFENSLRCIAVSSDHRGEKLINQLIGHLVEVQLQRGNSHIFVYTKRQTALFFKDLGFYPVAETGAVSFLENKRCGFRRFCRSLAPSLKPGRKAAIVMNANPFTLGHRALVETAAAENAQVHVFVLSEDKSLFPFRQRFELVQQGLEHLPNVVVHETGSYMISSATFPGYFLRDDRDIMAAHAELDATIFCELAQQLGISSRYLGEEDPDSTTGLYNEILSRTLPEKGIGCIIVPRQTYAGTVIRAGVVRKAIQEGNMETLRPLVPASTWQYLRSEGAKPVIQKIMEQTNVQYH